VSNKVVSIFDGQFMRHRRLPAMALPQGIQRKGPKSTNQYDVRRVVGSFYGGMEPLAIARHNKIHLAEFSAILREHSRPIGIDPLPIDRRLKAA